MHQAPLSMEFSRQEFWGGSPFLSPGDRPDPGINPRSPVLAGGFFTRVPPRKALEQYRKQEKLGLTHFGAHEYFVARGNKGP